MGMDIESGEGRDAPSEECKLEDGEEGDECDECDEQTEEDSSTYPSCKARRGNSSCLCQQFDHQSFCRRLESEADVVFQWTTFCKELVYHLFFPLSLPLMYWYEGGTNGIINRQYWGSRIAVTQWVLAICFYAMNVLSQFYVTPDIVIANMLIVMRHMVLATKYGFFTKSDMAEMRIKVLSHETLDDRTLFLAWMNPIPLRILKRELLLAAARNNMLHCSASLRVVPGASRHTVQEIMHQLSNEKKGGFMRSGRVRSRKSRKYSKVKSVNRTYCMRNSFSERALEDRWLQLCMSKLQDDPTLQLPESGETSEDDSTLGVGHVEETGGGNTHHVMVKIYHLQEGVDLPALMLAAHLLQHSGYLLSRKKFGHQLLKNPMRVWFAAGCIAITHTAIPYVVRAVTGEPSVWGGNLWYAYAINFSSILLNFHAMTASVSFMIAGVADFRRRYFSARLLNTLLKHGRVGKELFLPEAVEVEMCAREQKRQEERRKSDYHTGVAVDYGHASSIVGWWNMRVLVVDFGRVFSRRVKYYASYFCVYCALLMAFLLIAVFVKGTQASTYIMGVVVYDLLIFIGLLALIVFPGGETNKMHDGHGATLVHKRMELATKLRGPLACAPAEEKERYSFALEVMGTISEALTWDNCLTKVTILGFKAGGEVISVLLGFGGAAIGIVAQQFTSYIGGTSR